VSADLNPIFIRLRALLHKHTKKLLTVHDTDDHFYVNSKRVDAKGKPIFFGAVKVGSGKVAVHLMPLYEQPTLLDGVSPTLKKRMQGKSCFNFDAIDDALFSELDRLAAACARADQTRG
jgi:hypothetical protein